MRIREPLLRWRRLKGGDLSYPLQSRRKLRSLVIRKRRRSISKHWLSEPGLDRVIRAGYCSTSSRSLPGDPKKAGPDSAGRRRPAAGRIHTDFERGFIAAETISYDDFIGCDGEQGAKDAGKMRLEGRDYIVQDADVILFRFNV